MKFKEQLIALNLSEDQKVKLFDLMDYIIDNNDSCKDTWYASNQIFAAFGLDQLREAIQNVKESVDE